MSRRVLFVLLFIVLLDAIGFGLVYPLFSIMVFDPHSTLLHPSTSQATRGVILGILLSAMPIIQMMVAPWIGRLSDRYGRRLAILCCLSFGLLSCIGAAICVEMKFLVGLILSRACMGVCFVSYALVNTCIVDVSGEKDRGRRLAWVQSAFGAGFALGPLLGGILVNETLFSTVSFARPFIVSAVLVITNIICVVLWLPETRTPETQTSETQGNRRSGIRGLLSLDKTVLLLLLATFCFCFGWSMYFEFLPVLWIKRFTMSPSEVSVYFSYSGLWYVLLCTFLVGPMLKLFRPQILFEKASLMLAILIVPVFFITIPALYFLLLPLHNVCVAFLFPLAALIMSERAAPDDRGRIMGFMTSAESLGLGLSPCVAGPLLGLHLLTPMVVAIICLSLASITTRYVRKKEELEKSFLSA